MLLTSMVTAVIVTKGLCLKIPETEILTVTNNIIIMLVCWQHETTIVSETKRRGKGD